jgi:tryptophan-rich sensory protein
MKFNLGNILKLFISIIICQSAGFIGSIFTTPSIPTWYAFIKKPTFTPPSWLFGPVWITLYILMGVSAFLVWKKGLGTEGVKLALGIFIVQLIFNSLWSIVFFGYKSIFGGLIVIIILWILILLSIIFFLKISIVAGVLLIPYIFWVSFASLLNFSIYKLNP